MKSIKLTLDVIPVRLSNELIMGRLTRTIRFVSSQDSSSFDLFDTHPNVEQWKAYEVQERAYYVERKNREELQQAEQFGITIEQLREAKRRHDVYQSKKCEKAPDYELDYFVEKILSTSDVPELAEP